MEIKTTSKVYLKNVTCFQGSQQTHVNSMDYIQSNKQHGE